MSNCAVSCVVDTNVPLAANRKADASKDCVFACQKTLEAIMDSGHIYLDNSWLIIDEYKHKLSVKGQPGVGDRFLKWILTNHANAERCTQVPITPKDGCFCDGIPYDFEEFPDHPSLRGFDPSDRKFVAVSAAHPEHPPILNATDTDWWIVREALAECGIQVVFVCPEIEETYARKVQKGA